MPTAMMSRVRNDLRKFDLKDSKAIFMFSKKLNSSINIQDS
jgi:hypothetical protein